MNDMSRAIADGLSPFFTPDDVLEIRFLDMGGERGRTHAGWIVAKDIPQHAARIASLATAAGGAYFTPQRLDPALIGRGTPGKFVQVRRDGAATVPALTKDADVIERRYLIVDVDPARPSGVCATNDEKAAALAVADQVRTMMGLIGWPRPVQVDSGNGFHLYYRLPEPFGQTADPDPIAWALALVARHCDRPSAVVDRTVFNPARIMKIPGTFAKKGENTADRPHRQSQLIEVPDDWRA
jgi:hypothetical protein